MTCDGTSFRPAAGRPKTEGRDYDLDDVFGDSCHLLFKTSNMIISYTSSKSILLNLQFYKIIRSINTKSCQTFGLFMHKVYFGTRNTALL